jgi:alpha-L-fucosidase 2
MKKNYLLFILIAGFFTQCSIQENSKTAPGSILWYRQPAAEWIEALPLGNGKLGMMVFGDPVNERIQLNDDSMWPGDAGWAETDGNKEDLQEIREYLFRGNHVKADELFVEKFSRKKILRSHQTLGDVFIDFEHGDIQDYRRELDMEKALVKASYQADGNLIESEAFVSSPHKVMVIRYTSMNGEINAKIKMSRPADEGFPTSSVYIDSAGLMKMTGEVSQRNAIFNSESAPILEGVKFETCLKIENKGGEVISSEGILELKNVKEFTLYLVSNSSWYYPDFIEKNKEDLQNIENLTYEEIKNDHIVDFQSFYNRNEFSICQAITDTIPTDERLIKLKEGNEDHLLVEKLYNYGRYLLISSSRQGTNPANLQGLWNEHISAPWNADYHLNINLQMNYWAADATGLGDLNQPLFDYVDKLVVNGKQTASKNFGCRGSYLPHATDLWAPTWIRAATAYWGCSMGAGGWMMQHYWNHFEYTRDTLFLKERAFPAIEQVALFYSDWLIEDPRDGSLISAPSTSPENRFYDQNGNPVATCLGSAMDQQVIAEVFDNYLEACEILGQNPELKSKIALQRKKLRKGFVTGKEGRILEWDREYKEMEPGHRHMSHLYGFHPGTAISPEKTPEIFKAVRKTLDYRLENGGAGTGWSRAWLINCSARLLDGEMANEHIRLFLERSTLSNLFCSHPPFQIDGNFGFTSGIVEMLLQSYEDNTLRILPALPKSWESGFVKGLHARGGFTVDIEWEEGKVTKLRILSEFQNKIRILVNGESIEREFEKGEKVDILG